jgi:catalase
MPRLRSYSARSSSPTVVRSRIHRSRIRRAGNDDYTQPGDLFRLMDTDQKQQLFCNIAAAMQDVPEEIMRRQLGHFAKADRTYAARVAKPLSIKA